MSHSQQQLAVAVLRSACTTQSIYRRSPTKWSLFGSSLIPEIHYSISLKVGIWIISESARVFLRPGNHLIHSPTTPRTATKDGQWEETRVLPQAGTSPLAALC